MQKNIAIKIDILRRKNTKKYCQKFSQKVSKKYFIWHIRYVEGSKTTEDLSSAGNTGLLRPGGNLISLAHRVQFWRRVPDAQANLHGSAKNSQKKCRQEHYRNCRGVKYLSGPRCITASRQGLERDIFGGGVSAKQIG